MKIGFCVLSIFCFILLSCGDKKSTAEVVDDEKTDQKPIITEKAIENFKYKDYALSSESEDAIIEWENYQELALQISYLKKADLSFFNSDKEELKEFIDDFKTATPKQFLINPIISRTAVLETMLLRLNENLTLNNIKATDKLRSVKEVLIAFSNLNYQINKKLENDFYSKIQPE
jgi:hypothetical protein